ncbi:NADPH:quinone reductase (plasmid) [halophilic archaeon DL31]|nr:NADPH:quinone reductase [halophilic archaeon DL31]
MDAVVLDEYGSDPELRTVDEPELKPNEALISVEYCSLNNRDRVICSGQYGGISLPYVLGSDLAGRVIEVGEAVDQFDPGDRVVRYPLVSCGSCRHCRAGEVSTCEEFGVLDGGLAERAAVDEERLVALPNDVSLKDASCLPVAYLTAWRMLWTRGALRAGESALVIGGSGGVGVAAVQLASAMGATVTAVSSTPEYCDRLETLGATHAVNRHETDFADRAQELTDGRGVDLTIDHVGEATIPDSIAATANGGRVVLCGRTTGQLPQVDIHELFHRQLDLRGSTLGTPTEFCDLVMFLDEQTISPPVDRTIPLMDVVNGFEVLREGEAFGKILVAP